MFLREVGIVLMILLVIMMLKAVTLLTMSMSKLLNLELAEKMSP
jgi:hypothetical protein